MVKVILNGFIVSINHVHGTEKEIGRSRIKNHLKVPLFLYVLKECLINKIVIKDELKNCFLKCLNLSFKKKMYGNYINGKGLPIITSPGLISICLVNAAPCPGLGSKTTHLL